MTNGWMGRLCLALLTCAGLTVSAAGSEDWGDECPAGTLAGQDALLAGGDWYYSDVTFPPGRVLCESFPPPDQPALSEPIGAVSWHVSYVTWPGRRGCVKDHRFEIKFYPDLTNPDRPDVLSPAATYVVEPSVACIDGVGPQWPGSKRYVLGATLDPPLDPAAIGGRGWLSIASVEPAGECYALLAPAKEGDSTCYWYPMDNPTTGVFRAGDVHYCLGGVTAGACCDDWSGQCNEGTGEFICDLSGRRFKEGTCQDLDPPCGQVPGACCQADQTCVENMTRDDCEAITGAWWAGPETTCDDCCWIADCPAGSHIEDEPCGENRNPGCDGHPRMFEMIPPGGVVCGTVWADGGSADEDWYQLVLTGNASLTIRDVETHVPIRLAPCSESATNGRHEPPECDHLWYDDNTLYTPCVPQTPIQWDYARGRYWIIVRPEDGDGPISDFYPCGGANDYRFEVEVEYEPCGHICDFPGGLHRWENEPLDCYNPHPDTFNSGCDQYIAPPSPTIFITDNYTLYCAKSGWYEMPSPLCTGDLNCDDVVDFGDINPFVLALSDWSAWMTQYPDCPPRNADIDGDGLFGGWRGFGDINAFVDLLAGGGGQPQPCAHEPTPTPDTDWFEFTVLPGWARWASIFTYAEFPLIWEVYDPLAGCRAPPLEWHHTVPCLSSSIGTRCLAPGDYWLRIVPPPGVGCGMEYAVGLEEFRVCQPCEEDCEPSDTPENESCGEHLNDQCGVSAMTIPDPYWPNQSVICGTSYSLLRPEDNDEDWYQFDVPPGEGQYLVVVLNSDMPLTPWITVDGCSGSGWLVEDGVACDPDGELTGFYIDKQYVPGGSHVDLRITPELWNTTYTWYRNPWHAPCEQTYRLIAGYSPTEPQPGDFGIGTFKRLESTRVSEQAARQVGDALEN